MHIVQGNILVRIILEFSNLIFLLLCVSIMLDVKIAYLVLRSITILLHVIGFYMLFNTKGRTIFQRIQRFYILNLSASEMMLCIIGIVGNASRPYISKELSFSIQCFHQAGAVTLFYVTYYVLTLDRFMFAFLNFRYAVIVTLKKIYIFFAFVYCSTVTIPVVLILTVDPTASASLSDHLGLYYWTPANIAFILVAVLTYLYIFCSSQKRRRKMISHHNSNGIKRSRFLALVSTFLIGSFVLFFVIPDLIFTFFKLQNIPVSTTLTVATNTIFSAGYAIDAFLYIYLCRGI